METLGIDLFIILHLTSLVLGDKEMLTYVSEIGADRWNIESSKKTRISGFSRMKIQRAPQLQMMSLLQLKNKAVTSYITACKRNLCDVYE